MADESFGDHVISNQILYDKDGNRVLVPSDGGRNIGVRDIEQLEVLKAILTEVKKTNWYLSQLIDQDIDDLVVEDDEQ